MKTLSDIKRRAQVGVPMRMITYNGTPVHDHPLLGPVRRVKKVQGNAIQFEPAVEGRSGSWLYWPKAAYVKINSENTFTISEPDCAELVYEFV